MNLSLLFLAILMTKRAIFLCEEMKQDQTITFPEHLNGKVKALACITYSRCPSHILQ